MVTWYVHIVYDEKREEYYGHTEPLTKQGLKLSLICVLIMGMDPSARLHTDDQKG